MFLRWTHLFPSNISQPQRYLALHLANPNQQRSDLQFLDPSLLSPGTSREQELQSCPFQKYSSMITWFMPHHSAEPRAPCLICWCLRSEPQGKLLVCFPMESRPFLCCSWWFLAEAISRDKDEILSELLQFQRLGVTWALVFSLPFLVLVWDS